MDIHLEWAEKLRRLVNTAFAADGWLVRTGLQHLEAQAKYAESVTAWLLSSDNKHLGFLEAETGTGKTLGYLIPMMLYAALSGKRVGVSTFSIYLQNQILAHGGDLDRAQRYIAESGLGRVAVGQYLGKIAYVDPNRVSLRLAELKAERQIGEYHQRFQRWADNVSEIGSGLTREWIDMFGRLPDGIT